MKINLNLGDIFLEGNNQLSSRSQTSHTNRNINKNSVPLNILENCLDSLDLFKGLLEGIPHMKNRVIRDVSRAIELRTFCEDQILYEINQKAEAIYFCLSGSVSISILKVQNSSRTKESQIIQNKSGLQQNKQQHTEIELIQAGGGFGEAEFIASTRRTVQARVKEDSTLIGILQVQSVADVIQNYRMRVYYRKRDMFVKCPLFQGLSQSRIEFIVNNTKPMTIKISQKLVNEGSKADALYLVNKGKISVWKTNPQFENSLPSVFSSISYLYKKRPLKKKNRIMAGLLEEGSFFGDLQIVLNRNYEYTAVAMSDKVQLYYCDKRIVLSQIRQEQLEFTRSFYSKKIENLNIKIDRFQYISSKLEEQKQKDLQPPLNLEQIKLKRKLLRRYYEEKPSLIGCSSPCDINRMINRKITRAGLKQGQEKCPVLQLFQNHSLKKKFHEKTSFTPLTLIQSSLKKCLTQGNQVMNPEDESGQNINRAKSMFIKLKQKSINLHKVRNYKQQNLAIVGRVLGKYGNSSRLKSLSDIVEKIRLKRY